MPISKLPDSIGLSYHFMKAGEGPRVEKAHTAKRAAKHTRKGPKLL
jgi:hypothetical protein